MPKVPECDRCQYFLRSPFLVCAVNPCGPEGDSCAEFKASTKGNATTARQPIGGGYYLGDWVPHPFPLRSADEQLALLDWHPQFTGRCPTVRCRSQRETVESGTASTAIGKTRRNLDLPRTLPDFSVQQLPQPGLRFGLASPTSKFLFKLSPLMVQPLRRAA